MIEDTCGQCRVAFINVCLVLCLCLCLKSGNNCLSRLDLSGGFGHVVGPYLSDHMNLVYSGHSKPCEVLILTSTCLFQAIDVLVQSAL